MKKREFLISVSLALMTMTGFTSCQNADDEEPAKVAGGRYLSVQPGYLDNLSLVANDSNTVNFFDAFSRVVGVTKGKTYAKVPSAADANMSAELYNYLSDNFIYFKKVKTRAGNEGQSLSENENDCLTCTMAETYIKQDRKIIRL